MITFTKLFRISIYLLSLLFIISCSKDVNCGEETRTEIDIESYNDFLNINRYSTDDANFFSYYVYSHQDPMSQDSSIEWTILTELRNICIGDHPIIDFLILLRNPDTSISVIGGIQENLNIVQFAPIVVYQDGITYHSTINYNINGNYTGSATIHVTLSIRYKSKGSFVADRDYFFSNFDVGASRIIAHKQE